MEIKELEGKIKKNIENNPALYPFIARYWEIELIKSDDASVSTTTSYGHFGTQNIYQLFFYKPISKIIDFTVFHEE